jgi:hypothetical protein
MSTNSIHLIEIPVGGNGGLVWNRLHSEREDICEALLKEPVAGSGTETVMHGMSKGDALRAANWHRELLQSRLRKIDDALDRLMSGSYGNCSKCGRWIEDTKLDFDPAIAFCIDCWGRQQSQDRSIGLTERKSQTPLQAMPVCSSDHPTKKNHSGDGVNLATLAPFDTICARTLNSDYRIFMLNPKTGRALIEGGSDFVEPVEGTVNGSKLGSTFKVGWIGIGLRTEFWADGKIISTSPVQSFHVEHYTSDEVVSSLSH